MRDSAQILQPFLTYTCSVKAGLVTREDSDQENDLLMFFMTLEPVSVERVSYVRSEHKFESSILMVGKGVIQNRQRLDLTADGRFRLNSTRREQMIFLDSHRLSSYAVDKITNAMKLPVTERDNGWFKRRLQEYMDAMDFRGVHNVAAYFSVPAVNTQTREPYSLTFRTTYSEAVINKNDPALEGLLLVFILQ